MKKLRVTLAKDTDAALKAAAERDALAAQVSAAQAENDKLNFQIGHLERAFAGGGVALAEETPTKAKREKVLAALAQADVTPNTRVRLDKSIAAAGGGDKKKKQKKQQKTAKPAAQNEFDRGNFAANAQALSATALASTIAERYLSELGKTGAGTAAAEAIEQVRPRPSPPMDVTLPRGGCLQTAAQRGPLVNPFDAGAPQHGCTRMPFPDFGELRRSDG
jgi:hypothetical protein